SVRNSGERNGYALILYRLLWDKIAEDLKRLLHEVEWYLHEVEWCKHLASLLSSHLRRFGVAWTHTPCIKGGVKQRGKGRPQSQGGYRATANVKRMKDGEGTADALRVEDLTDHGSSPLIVQIANKDRFAAKVVLRRGLIDIAHLCLGPIRMD